MRFIHAETSFCLHAVPAETRTGWSNIHGVLETNQHPYQKLCEKDKNVMSYQRNKTNLHFRKLVNHLAEIWTLGSVLLEVKHVLTVASFGCPLLISCALPISVSVRGPALTTQSEAQDAFVVGMNNQWSPHSVCRSETLPPWGTLDCVVVFLGPQIHF